MMQVLAAALGPGGPDGRFKAGAVEALRALRSNAAPLCELLASSLDDPLVDWNVEAADKRARQAFEEAVALQLLALRGGGSTAPLRGAARAAAAALASCAEAVGGYAQLFGEVATAASTAAESHALQQRAEATLETAAEQERALVTAAAEGCASASRLEAQAAPLAAEAATRLQDCVAWQRRHAAVLAAMSPAPPGELTAPAELWQPAAAAMPLALVTGGASILQAALGMPPSDAPVSASVLLQASAADTHGAELLAQRSEAVAQLASLLQQYCAALTLLLGGPGYAAGTGHAAWLPALEAAAAADAPQVRTRPPAHRRWPPHSCGTPPPPHTPTPTSPPRSNPMLPQQALQLAAELAPRLPDAEPVRAVWRTLRASAGGAACLARQLASAADALQLERLDLTLGAEESRARLADGLAAEASLAAVAAAFADFSVAQAAAALALAAAGESSGAPEGLQRLVLGFATTAVAVRDAAPDQLFAAGGGGIGGGGVGAPSLLDWLPDVVQAADGLNALGAELHLVLPGLLALLAMPEQRSAAGAAIEAAALATRHAMAAASSGEEEGEAAPEAAEPLALLLETAAQLPALAALMQGVQQMQVLALQVASKASAADVSPLSPQHQADACEQLAGLWAALEAAAPAAVLGDDDAADTATAGVWTQCSAALTTALGQLLQRCVLPALAARMARTAAALRARAPLLQGAPALAAQAGAADSGAALAGGGQQQLPPSPRLVPFSDSQGLPGGGNDALLLGELEPASASAAGRAASDSGYSAAAAGGGEGEGRLVPFTDFDPGLPGEGARVWGGGGPRCSGAAAGCAPADLALPFLQMTCWNH